MTSVTTSGFKCQTQDMKCDTLMIRRTIRTPIHLDVSVAQLKPRRGPRGRVQQACICNSSQHRLHLETASSRLVPYCLNIGEGSATGSMTTPNSKDCQKLHMLKCPGSFDGDMSDSSLFQKQVEPSVSQVTRKHGSSSGVTPIL